MSCKCQSLIVLAPPVEHGKRRPRSSSNSSGTGASVEDNITQVEGIVQANYGGDCEVAKTEGEVNLLWSACKEALWSMLSLRDEGDEVWSTDVAVPLSGLPDIIEVSKCEMDELNLFASVIGHVGNGNFHEGIFLQQQRF